MTTYSCLLCDKVTDNPACAECDAFVEGLSPEKLCIYCGDTATHTNSQLTNPENPQRTIYTDACAECYAAMRAERDLTMTTQHHDWTSPTRRVADAYAMYHDTDTLDEYRDAMLAKHPEYSSEINAIVADIIESAPVAEE